MDLERVVGAASQAALLIVWFMVVVLTAKVYLKLLGTSGDRPSGEMTAEKVRIKRSFLAFILCFMPALVLWLPAFGVVPSTDPIFVPAVLAWLVILVFGGLQFYLNLVPTKAAMMAVMGMEGTQTSGQGASVRSVSAKEPRRNV